MSPRLITEGLRKKDSGKNGSGTKGTAMIMSLLVRVGAIESPSQIHSWAMFDAKVNPTQAHTPALPTHCIGPIALT